MKAHVDVIPRGVQHRRLVVKQPAQVLHQVEDHHHHAEHPKHEPEGAQEFADDVTVETFHPSHALRQLHDHSVFPLPEGAGLNLLSRFPHEV